MARGSMDQITVRWFYYFLKTQIFDKNHKNSTIYDQ